MLQITQDALHIFRATARQMPQAHTKCLRLIVSKDGVALSFELPQSGDEMVHDQGRAVLAVPQKIAGTLSDMTLDVIDDGRFVLS